MGELIGIAKAARSLGISPRKLCKRIYRAGIPALDGMVRFDELKKIAPELETEAPIIEKTTSVRQNAHLHRNRPGPPPSEEDLARKLKRTLSELIFEREQREKYQIIFEQLLRELGRLQDAEDEKKRDTALDLSRWLANKLQS